MRLYALLLPFLTLLSFTFAWTKEDHEIFRLRDELLTAEGPNATFYNFLGVKNTASLDEINKKYRAKSRQLHPDKAVPALLAERVAARKPSKSAGSKPGVHVQKGPTQKERAQVLKFANERYARLGVVISIFRGPARERYDHFLAQGFPVWKGTGYYYARFRPGLVSVLLSLVLVLGGAVHYVALYIGWRRHRDFVERYIQHARRMAWGDMGMPTVDNAINGTNGAPTPQDLAAMDEAQGGAMNRRQKRMQEKGSKKKDMSKTAKTARNSGVSRPVDAEPIGQGPMGSKKKVVAENGKVLIVDSEGNVFLEETTEEGQMHELLLDVSDDYLDMMILGVLTSLQPNEIERPTILQTALFRVPVWAYSQIANRVMGKSGPSAEVTIMEDQELITTSPESHGDEVIESATSINTNAEARKRKSRGKR
ncbi:MAG: hypothetical protein M1828_000088 [Chrysothrix sp. TS-e1954]|nr:MAG: hypothetical protein M1828_000088 [Chrysothrix sp. TS-e1954]